MQSLLTESQIFLGKLIFTALTLGSGFKGGEVTPLFFIGATLGNALSYILSLPPALLPGIGFVAVFAGAAIKATFENRETPLPAQEAD